MQGLAATDEHRHRAGGGVRRRAWVPLVFMPSLMPTFAANLGNERGVKETWDAAQKEALQRPASRLAAPAQPR